MVTIMEIQVLLLYILNVVDKIKKKLIVSDKKH